MNHEDKPDTMLIHIGSNDMVSFKQNGLNVKDVFPKIIDVGLYCREYSVKEVIISSVLVKQNFQLTGIIRQINDLSSEYCVSNNFHYLTNDNSSKKIMERCYSDVNNILAENFIS